jgi:putative endonuclease
MYTTYILFSLKLNKFYTGYSSDFSRRLEEHNRGKTPFMKSGVPWSRVYSTEFKTKKEALILEKLIKKRGAARFLTDNQIKVG